MSSVFCLKIINAIAVNIGIVGAEHVREIEPGEMIVIGPEGIKSTFPFERTAPRPCIFEKVYFSRPDSILGGQSVYETRHV